MHVGGEAHGGGCAQHMRLCGEVAAPAGIRAERQLAGFTKRRRLPCGVKCERLLRGAAVAAAKGGLDAQFPNVAGIGVGAHGPAGQAQVPLLLVRQPQCEGGIGQGVRLLGVAKLDVDASVRRLNVGKARCVACDGLCAVGALCTCAACETTPCRFQYPA